MHLIRKNTRTHLCACKKVSLPKWPMSLPTKIHQPRYFNEVILKDDFVSTVGIDILIGLSINAPNWRQSRRCLALLLTQRSIMQRKINTRKISNCQNGQNQQSHFVRLFESHKSYHRWLTNINLNWSDSKIWCRHFLVLNNNIKYSVWLHTKKKSYYIRKSSLVWKSFFEVDRKI